MLNDENIELNSLVAGEKVYNYFLDKENGDKRKALTSYKGIVTQTHLVDRVLEIEKKLKDR